MRFPAVADAFYPGNREAIASFMKQAIVPPPHPPLSLIGAIVPHAGWIYSGRAAGLVYGAIKHVFRTPPLFVILSPNHTGAGAAVSVSFEDWQTPLGVIKTDTAFAKKLLSSSQEMTADEYAHEGEHSIEVQLPFIQTIFPTASFVGITIMAHDFSVAEDIARALATARKDETRDVIILASSDFTHYEPASVAERKDKAALSFVEALDGKGFFNFVTGHQLSICGAMPITVLLEYARLVGAQRGRVLLYTHSGVVTRDNSSVVAYVGAVIE